MKFLSLLFIILFGFANAQKKSDSTKLPKMPRQKMEIQDFSKIKNKDSLFTKSRYRIYCKVPDTSLYRMPNRKAKTEKLMALKQTEKEKAKVEYFVPEYQFPLIKKKENK